MFPYSHYREQNTSDISPYYQSPSNTGAQVQYQTQYGITPQVVYTAPVYNVTNVTVNINNGYQDNMHPYSYVPNGVYGSSSQTSGSNTEYNQQYGTVSQYQNAIVPQKQTSRVYVHPFSSYYGTVTNYTSLSQTKEELWTPITVCDEGYWICRAGKVANNQRRIIGNYRGVYHTVYLPVNGVPTFFSIHKLVLIHLIENDDPNKTEGDHIDRNKHNNNDYNLRFVTHGENNYNVIKKSSGGRVIIQRICNITGDVKDEGKISYYMKMGYSYDCIRYSYSINRLFEGYIWKKKVINMYDKLGMKMLQRYCDLKGIDISTIKDIVFTQIPGYSRYWIIRAGDIWSTLIGDWIRPSISPSGYWIVALIPDGSSYSRSQRLHKLVNATYHGAMPPQEGMVCNHKDGNKLNPHEENVEWATLSENSVHAVDNGLTASIKICQFRMDRSFVQLFMTKERAKVECRRLKGDLNESNVTGNHIWINRDVCIANNNGTYSLPPDLDIYGCYNTSLKRPIEIISKEDFLIYTGYKTPNPTGDIGISPKVCMFDTDGIYKRTFANPTEAAAWANVSGSSLGINLTGRGKTCAGWVFVRQCECIKEADGSYRIPPDRIPPKNRVCMFDRAGVLQFIFPSTTEAANWVGSDDTKIITGHMNKKKITCGDGKHIFEREDKCERDPNGICILPPDRMPKGRIFMFEENRSLKETFYTLADAAEWLGLKRKSTGGVRNSINTGKIYRGYFFQRESS